jgi:hypothetical protein
MNEQDEKKFYTGMVLLGLLVRGHPLNGIPAATRIIVNETMKEEETK